MKVIDWMIKHYFKRLASTGTDDVNKNKEFVVSANIAALIAGLITLPYVFIYYFIDNDTMMYVNLFFLFAYPQTIVLNKYHHYRYAKMIIILLGYLHISAVSLYYGEVTRFDLYFFLIPIISIFIFPKEDKAIMFVGAMLFFIFFFTIQYLYTIVPSAALSPSLAKMLFYSTIVFVVLFIMFFVYSFRSESLNLQEELAHLANRDFLTNLYNRRYFSELVHKMIRVAKKEKKPLTIIMLDIDKFKKVNDTYGHAIGDDVIKALAHTLQENTREEDIVARIGGEEFTIALPNTDKHTASHMAQNIRKVVEQQQIQLDNNDTISFTISIGIDSLQHNKDKSLSDILTRADFALYEAKRTGRNKVILF